MSSLSNEIRNAHWVTSSRSNGNGGACVEVALASEFVGVRDSKDREGGPLVFGREQWGSFVASLQE